MSDGIMREQLQRSQYLWTVRRITKRLREDQTPDFSDLQKAIELGPEAHRAYWEFMDDAMRQGLVQIAHKTYPTVLVPKELADEIESIFTEEQLND